MSRIRRWLAKLASFYDSDRRRRPRLVVNLEAVLAFGVSVYDVVVTDINRDGAAVRSASPLERNTLVFIRIPERGLSGFAFVRRCSPSGEIYIIGLEFREPLTRGPDKAGAPDHYF